MANTAEWFGQSGGALIGRLWVAQQMGCALLGSGYAPNLDTHMRYSDVAPSEIASGGGYAAGGAQIANRSTSYDSAANETSLLGDDVTWGPGATITARYAVVYEMTTTDKYLWIFLDFQQVVTVTNGVFTVDWTGGQGSVQSAGPV
jgi:hypothetical protein